MSIQPVGSRNPRFEFCDRIRKLRRSVAHMSQGEMAATLGVTRQAYAAWEAGTTKPGDIVGIARRIEDHWPDRVSAAWMLGVDDDPTPPPTPPAVRLHQPPDTPTRYLHSVDEGDGTSVHDEALAYVRLADEAGSRDLLLPRVDSNHQPFVCMPGGTNVRQLRRSQRRYPQPQDAIHSQLAA